MDKITRPQKASVALQLHIENKCGCTLSSNPNNCIYQPFLDGWDFTPDVGNGQKRGEIFTPRFIVDKMITDAQILPKEAIYSLDYKTLTKVKAQQHITSKINEPAIGTANFTATILWHKVEYAHHVATVGKTLNLNKYNLLVTQALASLYANDIDCGNLQTTKWRLLRSSEIYTEENIKYWLNYTLKSVHKRLDAETKISIEQSVRRSLLSASHNWGTADRDKGVLDVLYYKHTGSEIPAHLKILWKSIMDENFKLFNGIKETDTVEEGFVVAGWRNIEWCWWDFTQDKLGEITENTTKISLAYQIEYGKLGKLKAELSELENKKVSIQGALVEIVDFATVEDKKAYVTKRKEVDKQTLKIERILSKNKKTAEETNKPVRKMAGDTLF